MQLIRSSCLVRYSGGQEQRMKDLGRKRIVRLYHCYKSKSKVNIVSSHLVQQCMDQLCLHQVVNSVQLSITVLQTHNYVIQHINNEGCGLS